MKTISISDLENAVTGKRVLIDTNIIIYLTDSVQPYAGLSRRLFEIIENGESEGVISIISLVEIMQGPLRKGQKEKAIQVKNYLLNFPNITCQETTKNVFDQIGTDPSISWSKLRAVDSMIIASGLTSSVNLIISNDKHFKKAVPKEILLSFDV